MNIKEYQSRLFFAFITNYQTQPPQIIKFIA